MGQQVLLQERHRQRDCRVWMDLLNFTAIFCLRQENRIWMDEMFISVIVFRI